MAQEIEVSFAENEPIRLTGIVTGVISAAIGGIVLYLQTNDWKASLATALIAVGGVVATVEASRKKVVSPATLERNTGQTIDQLT